MTSQGPARRRGRRPRNINVAHFAMGVLFLTWLGFAVATGESRPQVLDLLLGSIGGVWFAMVVREQGRKDEAVAAKVDELTAELRGDDPTPATGARDGG